jgi:O-antigen/teichoic acid export membrane protein
MFPVYARYQDDERQLRHFYLTCVKYLCLVTFPIMSALCLLAAEVVDICLGAEWGTAVVPLRWLALASMIESAGWTGATVIRACGLPGLQLKIRSMLSVVVIVPGVVVGAYLGGAAGAACAIAAISLVSRAVYFHWLRRLIGLELRAFVLALRHGAIAAALVAAGVLGARMLVVSDGDTLAAAVVLATIALTAYARVGLKEECATVLSHLRATSKRSPAGRASVISEAGAAE